MNNMFRIRGASVCTRDFERTVLWQTVSLDSYAARSTTEYRSKKKATYDEIASSTRYAKCDYGGEPFDAYHNRKHRYPLQRQGIPIIHQYSPPASAWLCPPSLAAQWRKCIKFRSVTHLALAFGITKAKASATIPSDEHLPVARRMEGGGADSRGEF
jgi:hypothetical protein